MVISPGSLTPQGIAGAAKDGGISLIALLLIALLGGGAWITVDVLREGFAGLTAAQKESTVAQQETTASNRTQFERMHEGQQQTRELLQELVRQREGR